MSKKYKLASGFSQNQIDNQTGGFFSIPMTPATPIINPFTAPLSPVIPMVNPFTAQIQVANPMLPTINPTFNTYPRPMILGPKINIFPNKHKYVQYPCQTNQIVTRPICQQKMIVTNPCIKKKCDLNLIDLLTNVNYSKNSSILSPLSDDLPIRDFFKNY